MLFFDPNFNLLQLRKCCWTEQNLDALQMVGKHRQRAVFISGGTVTRSSFTQKNGFDVHHPAFDLTYNWIETSGRSGGVIVCQCRRQDRQTEK